MALDDFARRDPATGAKDAAAAREGEDLFDFPVVEMTADGSGPPPSKSKSDRSAPVPPPILPAKKHAAPPSPSMDVASTDAPRRDHAAHAKSRDGGTAGDARDRTMPEPRAGATSGATESPSHAPAPRVHARPISPMADVDSAPLAADAFAPVAEVADAADAGEHGTSDADESDVDSRTQPRSTRREITGTLAWAAIGALALVNVAGFFALWKSNRSFASAVDGLRDDLAVTAHDMQVANGAAGTLAPHTDAATASDVRDEARATRIESTPEETAIALARKEIELGRFAAARVRLHRLLAIADRFDSSTRADLEARASFLVGESYAVQLERRLEAAR